MLKSLIIPVTAFVLPLLLYVATLAPSFVSTDSAEFALCVHYWGVCHPPGFPLYIAIGHFFVNIFPFWSLIYKVGLLSALYGAGAIFFVFLTLRALKVNSYNALFTALLLATTADFWRLSVIADVFTFGALLLSLAFFLLFSGRKYWAFLALGLCSSHMYITAFLWPVFVWYSWGLRRMGHIGLIGLIRRVGLAGLIFLAGLFPQVVMYWRMSVNPVVNWDHVASFSQFVDFLRRKEFGGFFLLSNSQLRFQLGYPIGHLFLLVWKILVEYLFVLPLFVAVAVFMIGARKEKGLLVLFFSLLIATLLQVSSLGTIDPIAKDSLEAFDLGKFYVMILVIFALIAGLVLDRFTKKFLKENVVWPLFLLLAVICLNLLFNFRANNYSQSFYSQNYILDALDEVPKGGLVITYDHQFYFGARYFQEIEGKYKDIDVLYITTNNPDAKFYRPDLFIRARDDKFAAQFADAEVNPTEKNVADAISVNRDRDIYFLISTPFTFFDFLGHYSRPHGLFRRFENSGNALVAGDEFLLDVMFRNGGAKKQDLYHVDQRLEADAYTYVFAKSAEDFAKNGEFDKALKLLDRARAIDDKYKVVDKLTSAVSVIVRANFEQMVEEKNVNGLMALGQAYFETGYFKGSEQVFEALIAIDPNNAYYLTNAGSAYASAGEKQKAIFYFEKALKINPSLDLAKQGLQSLGK